MNINNFTINDMIYNINELIRNQPTINDKVNFRGKEDLFFCYVLFRKNKIILSGVFNFFWLIWNNKKWFLLILGHY